MENQPAKADSQPSGAATPVVAASFAKQLLQGALLMPPPQETTWSQLSCEELAPFFPKYEVLRILGRGGMGGVYAGRDKELQRLVAIKLLPPELGELPGFIERFRREAQALAKLEHPNIVNIYEMGETPGGHLFFVMEHVAGKDLRRCMKSTQEPVEKAPRHVLPQSKVLEIVLQICEALHFAHSKGIVHRDIKPANILIRDDGRVKVADFGLARPLNADERELFPTDQEEIMGTRGYMAPEMLSGGATDHRVDVFAVGVLLYEMLTGERMARPDNTAPRRVLPHKQLDQIIAKATHEEPEKRYGKISDLQKELTAVVLREGRTRRRWMVASVLVATIGGAAAYALKAPDAPAPVVQRLMIYEGFNYPPQEDGIFKHGTFRRGYPGADADIIAGSLEYVDAVGNKLITSGNAAFVDGAEEQSEMNNVCPINVPLGTSGEIWISLIAQRTSAPSQRFFNFTLRTLDNVSIPHDPNAVPDEIIAVGVMTDAISQNWQIWDRSSHSPVGGEAISNTASSERSFLLIRGELNVDGKPNERFTLWVNPRLDHNPDHQEAVYFTTKYTNLADWGELKEMRLAAGSLKDNTKAPSWLVDEIRIATTWQEVTPHVSAAKR